MVDRGKILKKIYRLSCEMGSGKEVVRHGSRRRRHLVERNRNGLGLKGSDHDRQAAFVDFGLQQQRVRTRRALTVGEALNGQGDERSRHGLVQVRLQRRGQTRNNIKRIAHDSVVGGLKERSLRVAVDHHNGL